MQMEFPSWGRSGWYAVKCPCSPQKCLNFSCRLNTSFFRRFYFGRKFFSKAGLCVGLHGKRVLCELFIRCNSSGGKHSECRIIIFFLLEKLLCITVLYAQGCSAQRLHLSVQVRSPSERFTSAQEEYVTIKCWWLWCVISHLSYLLWWVVLCLFCFSEFTLAGNCIIKTWLKQHAHFCNV